MTSSRKLLIILTASLFLPVMTGYSGQDTLALLPAGSMQPVTTGNIPNEVEMPMMEFPPLRPMGFPKVQNMRFQKVQDMQFAPVETFVDGADLYRRHCSDCHGIQTTSELRGLRFTQFSSAVTAKKSGINSISRLKKEEILAIISALENSPAS